MKNSLQIPMAVHDNYCGGYGNPGSVGNGYLLGLVLGVGKTKITSQVEAPLLDRIVAFDKAEVKGTNIGQINMVTVSSFCGPMGLIWGYDLAKHPNVHMPHESGPEKIVHNGRVIPLYSLDPLLHATKALFGTLENKRFPFMPGEHVPCATKSIEHEGLRYLYCSMSVGIPEDRAKEACLLMEDVGYVESDENSVKKNLIRNAAESVARIGETQGIEYIEILTGLKTMYVGWGEVGSALVAAPYFTLAKNAVPKNSTSNPRALSSMSLTDWEMHIFGEHMD